MASEKVIGKQNARRVIRRLETARSKLGLDTIDSFYLMAGRNKNIPAQVVRNHIADYYLSMQGDQKVDPPGYVRALINATLKKPQRKQRHRGLSVASEFGEDAAYA